MGLVESSVVLCLIFAEPPDCFPSRLHNFAFPPAVFRTQISPHPGQHVVPSRQVWGDISLWSGFAIVKMLKQTKCLSPDKWAKKMWNIHTMGWYSVLKKESKSAVCDNMDEPRGHYAKGNSPSQKDKSRRPPVISSVQSLSRVWLPKDCSTPGLPVHHQLPEFTQTHVHWVGDAI